MNHTPGPWRRGAKSKNIVYAADGRNIIAVCVNGIASALRSDAEVEANTNIVVAAPELLAAMKELLAANDPGVLPSTGSFAGDVARAHAAAEKARAAVAKAEGA